MLQNQSESFTLFRRNVYRVKAGRISHVLSKCRDRSQECRASVLPSSFRLVDHHHKAPALSCLSLDEEWTTQGGEARLPFFSSLSLIANFHLLLVRYCQISQVGITMSPRSHSDHCELYIATDIDYSCPRLTSALRATWRS